LKLAGKPDQSEFSIQEVISWQYSTYARAWLSIFRLTIADNSRPTIQDTKHAALFYSLNTIIAVRSISETHVGAQQGSLRVFGYQARDVETANLETRNAEESNTAHARKRSVVCTHSYFLPAKHWITYFGDNVSFSTAPFNISNILSGE